MPKATKSVSMPEPLGLYARRVFRRAEHFLEACRETGGSEPLRWPHVTFFLLNHALELMLKAYLASKGVDKRGVKELGHRLNDLLRGCEARGLPPIEDLDNLVKHLALMNSDHDFRYPSPYRLKLPTLSECLVVMDALSAAIGPTVKAEGVRASIQLASETRHLEKGTKVVWSD